MNKTFSRFVIVFALVALLAGAFAFAVPQAKASDGTFNISVYHGINGRSLGLSKELPVEARVYDGNNVLLDTIPLEFKDRFTADLPAGTYKIDVFSLELGTVVDSMTVGPVEIPEGVDVRIQAQLSAGKTPILNVRVK
jgi:flagellar hook assembly protein FlgD